MELLLSEAGPRECPVDGPAELPEAHGPANKSAECSQCSAVGPAGADRRI